MKRLMTAGIAITAALALAACGSGSSGGASSAAGSGTGSTTVFVRQLTGVGSVIVDHSGKALYSSNVEAGGKIACDNACNAFWKPLTPGAGKPTASAGAGQFGVITRPDGSKQVTDNGKPLYTFSEDSPGNATGNGFTDNFGGHHFTWNVVHAGGNTASATAGADSTGGTPSTTGRPGGNYGY
jgi:predicted lipoprotein with Yx(FWY)xxD motif